MYINEKMSIIEKNIIKSVKMNKYKNYVDYNHDKICLVDERRDKETRTTTKLKLLKSFEKSC